MKSTSSSAILGSFLCHVLYVGSSLSVPRAPGRTVGPDRRTAGGGWSIVSLLRPAGGGYRGSALYIDRLSVVFLPLPVAIRSLADPRYSPVSQGARARPGGGGSPMSAVSPCGPHITARFPQ